MLAVYFNMLGSVVLFYGEPCVQTVRNVIHTLFCRNVLIQIEIQLREKERT